MEEKMKMKRFDRVSSWYEKHIFSNEHDIDVEIIEETTEGDTNILIAKSIATKRKKGKKDKRKNSSIERKKKKIAIDKKIERSKRVSSWYNKYLFSDEYDLRVEIIEETTEGDTNIIIIKHITTKRK